MKYYFVSELLAVAKDLRFHTKNGETALFSVAPHSAAIHVEDHNIS